MLFFWLVLFVGKPFVEFLILHFDYVLEMKVIFFFKITCRLYKTILLAFFVRKKLVFVENLMLPNLRISFTGFSKGVLLKLRWIKRDFQRVVLRKHFALKLLLFFLEFLIFTWRIQKLFWLLFFLRKLTHGKEKVLLEIDWVLKKLINFCFRFSNTHISLQTNRKRKNSQHGWNLRKNF